MIDELPETIRVDEEGKGLLRGVAADSALRQCLLQLVNLCLGEVVGLERKRRCSFNAS